MRDFVYFKTISDFHTYADLPQPEHPLISLIDYSKVRYSTESSQIKWLQDHYSIGLKRNVNGKFNYGHQPYDFNEGLLSFIAPQQVLEIEFDPTAKSDPSGWLLLIHPDFLWNTPLAKNIKNYEFFGYAVNEALFLSDKEESVIVGILRNIQGEYRAGIDKFSSSIIAAQLELLLNYAQRYYERQFFSRAKTNHQILIRLEQTLTTYFNEEGPLEKKIPTVTQIAESLHLSPNYLSSMLRVLTGKSTQEHIHTRLIEKAKQQLSGTEFTISEIAYELGFEHPASFSKLFKNKTKLSPSEFRHSFN